jgi:hypothetical protein
MADRSHLPLEQEVREVGKTIWSPILIKVFLFFCKDKKLE